MRALFKQFHTRCLAIAKRCTLFLKGVTVRVYIAITVSVAALMAAGAFWFFFFTAPAAFPTHDRVIVKEGSSLHDVAEGLKEAQVIRSPLMFQAFVRLHKGEGGVRAGTYMFPERFSVALIARALVEGSYEVPPQRVTVFEGMRVTEIAELLESQKLVDAATFVELALPYEGYLFPETYFIPEDYTEEGILTLMRDTYEEKIALLRTAIASSTFTEAEVVTLASILEREARNDDSMRIVAGILESRLTIGMPLQVDATLNYTLGKTSAELTMDDLKEESPYNTYTHNQLPPTPISNPGLAALAAVLDPISTDYLYYLTGNDGVFYYARTFEEHKVNKARHLW